MLVSPVRFWPSAPTAADIQAPLKTSGAFCSPRSTVDSGSVQIVAVNRPQICNKLRGVLRVRSIWTCASRERIMDLTSGRPIPVPLTSHTARSWHRPFFDRTSTAEVLAMSTSLPSSTSSPDSDTASNGTHLSSTTAAVTIVTSKVSRSRQFLTIWRPRVLASFIHTAPITPIVAAVVTVTTNPGTSSSSSLSTFGTAFLYLVVTWIALSVIDLILGLSRADRVDASSYRQLKQRYQLLANQARAQAALPEITELLEYEGPQWVTGEAYEDLWRRIHEAEDYSIRELEVGRILGLVDSAALRISDSSMRDKKDLTQKLTDARDAIVKNESDVKMAAAIDDVVLVWRAIHGYRDDRWAGIRRASNSLMLTCAVTALTGYGVLWVVRLIGVARTDLQHASVMMLTGALVALLNRLYTQLNSSTVVEDYGLSLAHLIVAPLLGALAAIMGLVVISQFRNQTGLNVDINPENLVTAAAFGLTPGLLFDRLKDHAEQLKAQIQSTSVGESQN